jgi:hypothetical protein
VIRVAGKGPAGAPVRLPDLIAHWTPRANAGPFRLRTPPLACELGATRLTGQHAPEGFWVLRSPRTPGPEAGQSLAAEVLGQLLLDQVAAP